jgi:hypothetical protein
MLTPTLTTNPEKIIGRVSAMAMVDEEFKARLTADPEGVLAEAGLDLPPEMTVEIRFSFDDVPADVGDETLYLVIPEADELSEEDLSVTTVATASCQSTASTFSTAPSCAGCASTASTQSCS